MFRVLDRRGTGKTGRLMLLAKETGATIVCSNPYAMREKSHAYGIIGLNFISYVQFDNEQIPNEKFLIDDLDKYLEMKGIIGYTINSEE